METTSLTTENVWNRAKQGVF